MGSILGPNHGMAKDLKNCTKCCYVRCAVIVQGLILSKTGATHFHAQLRHPDKTFAIKEFVVYNGRDLEYFGLLNGPT